MTLQSVLQRLPIVRALVIGDAMVDWYSFGRVERLSPEAPVPIFIEEREEWRPGGANNVAAQMQALGCCVAADFSPEPHSVKHRFVVGHQVLLRVDEDHHPQAVGVSPSLRLALQAQPDVIVLSDYAKGWCSDELCRWVINAANARARPIPVVVDPKGTDWSKYAGAALICPNQREWDQAGEWAHRRGISEWPDFRTVLLKQGADGCQLLRQLPNGGWHTQLFRARVRHVYDVTGAGDTVVATVAAVLGAGGTAEEAAELAMLAAGYVVGEVGTAVCPIEVLYGLVGESDGETKEQKPTV